MHERHTVSIRFDLDPEDQQRLLRDQGLQAMTCGDPHTRDLIARYFDTRDHALYLHGAALCVCRFGEQWLQSVIPLRMVEAVYDAPPPEVPLRADTPEPERLDDIAQGAVPAIAPSELQPVFTVERRAHRRVLSRNDGQIVAVLTEGTIRTPAASLPLRHLELSSPQGDTENLLGLAAELSERINLHPAVLGEAARGYQALRGEQPRPSKGGDLQLDPAASADDALALVVGDCLVQIRANIPAVLSETDPEGVHQMRVGLRRLRSALTVFRDVLPESRTAAIKERLRWLGGTLGPARDIDVFIGETLAPLAAAMGGTESFERLQPLAMAQREARYARVREMLSSQRFGQCMIELAAWHALRQWRVASQHSVESTLAESAQAFASRQLERRDRKIRKTGAKLRDKPAAEKHALRIRIKRLRYAAEFFRSLYPAAETSRYIKHLAALQDTLGHLNDVATAEEILTTLLAASDDGERVRLSHAAGFVAGWISHAAVRRLKKLDRTWSRFLSKGPFWK